MRAAAAGSLDLGLVAALAVTASVLCSAPSVAPAARVAVALPLVLVLPGYALTAAAFPRLARTSGEAVALTLGGSISVAILVGLILDLTPWGLERRTWAVALGGTTLVIASVALAVRGNRSRR